MKELLHCLNSLRAMGLGGCCVTQCFPYNVARLYSCTGLRDRLLGTRFPKYGYLFGLAPSNAGSPFDGGSGVYPRPFAANTLAGGYETRAVRALKPTRIRNRICTIEHSGIVPE